MPLPLLTRHAEGAAAEFSSRSPDRQQGFLTDVVQLLSLPAYQAKYRAGIARIGMTPEKVSGH